MRPASQKPGSNNSARRTPPQGCSAAALIPHPPLIRLPLSVASACLPFLAVHPPPASPVALKAVAPLKHSEAPPLSPAYSPSFEILQSARVHFAAPLV